MAKGRTEVTIAAVDRIETLTQEFISFRRKGVEAMIGMALVAEQAHAEFMRRAEERKAQGLPASGWEDYVGWVSVTCGMSPWYAKKFLHVAKFVALYGTEVLPQQTVVLKLAAPGVPESAIKQVLDRTANGEKLSVEDAQEIINDASDKLQVQEVFILANAPNATHEAWADGIISTTTAYMVTLAYCECEMTLTRQVLERHAISDHRIVEYFEKMEERSLDSLLKVPDDQLETIFNSGMLQAVDGDEKFPPLPIIEINLRDIKAYYAHNCKLIAIEENDPPLVYLDTPAFIFSYEERQNSQGQTLQAIVLTMSKLEWDGIQKQKDVGELVRLKLQEPKGG